MLAPRQVAELLQLRAAHAAAAVRADVLRGQRRAGRARRHVPDGSALSRTASSSSRVRAPELSAMAYRVGFDVGGTFTDFVLQSPAGELLTGKRLTTYPDPSEACLAGLDELMARAGVAWADVAPGRARHDARLEHRHRAQGAAASACSPRAASATCSSSAARSATRSTTSRSRSRRRSIPRRLIGEVTERVLADGSVRTPLDEADARRAIRALAARGVTHARRLPAPRLPEPRARAAASPRSPPRRRRDVAVTLSHEVSPTFREYERDLDHGRQRLRDDGASATTCAGCSAALGERGYRGPAVRHAVLGRRRDGGGDGALPGADDRVGAGGGRAHGRRATAS